MLEVFEVFVHLLAGIASADDKKDSGWRWITFFLVLILALFGLRLVGCCRGEGLMQAISS